MSKGETTALATTFVEAFIRTVRLLLPLLDVCE